MKESKKTIKNLNNIIEHQRISLIQKREALRIERDLQRAATVGVEFLEGQNTKLQQANAVYRQRSIEANVRSQHWENKFKEENRIVEHQKVEIAAKDDKLQILAEVIVKTSIDNDHKTRVPDMSHQQCPICHKYYHDQQICFSFKCACKWYRVLHQDCMVKYLAKHPKWECLVCQTPLGRRLFSSIDLMREKIKTESPDIPTTSSTHETVQSLYPTHWEVSVQTESESDI